MIPFIKRSTSRIIRIHVLKSEVDSELKNLWGFNKNKTKQLNHGNRKGPFFKKLGNF